MGGGPGGGRGKLREGGGSFGWTETVFGGVGGDDLGGGGGGHGTRMGGGGARRVGIVNGMDADSWGARVGVHWAMTRDCRWRVGGENTRSPPSEAERRCVSRAVGCRVGAWDTERTRRRTATFAAYVMASWLSKSSSGGAGRQSSGMGARLGTERAPAFWGCAGIEWLGTAPGARCGSGGSGSRVRSGRATLDLVRRSEVPARGTSSGAGVPSTGHEALFSLLARRRPG